MKAIKGGLLFGILALVASACFNPPEFPITPTIDYRGDICFKQAKGPGETDSLIVTILFKDGNGDLGLGQDELDEPFHEDDFFVITNGQLTPIGRKRLYSNVIEQFLDIPNGIQGELARVRSHKNPAYASLIPAYTDFFSTCTFFKYDTVFISEEDIGVLDTSTTNVVDVYEDGVNPDIYAVADTFYYRKNPTYANIEVEFLVKEGSNFVSYDWFKETCGADFNQRFPVLTEKVGGPLEGNLRYSMISAGIRNTFSIKTLKLRIKIRDRALNVSNTVETEEFTLDKITCN